LKEKSGLFIDMKVPTRVVTNDVCKNVKRAKLYSKMLMKYRIEREIEYLVDALHMVYNGIKM
jgi:hypothetical protein